MSRPLPSPDSVTRPQRSLDEAALRAWPLPAIAERSSKNDRGRVLVVAGSPQMPGAALLAATAALRAGAGKLAIATSASTAPLVAMAMPEARVIAWPETPDGGPAPGSAAMLKDTVSRSDVVLVGPGMQDDDAVAAMVADLVRHHPDPSRLSLVLDAAAMGAAEAVCHWLSPAAEDSEHVYSGKAPGPRLLLTPHWGEMAHLNRCSVDDLHRDLAATAAVAAQRWNAVVALKGPPTHIAAPDRPVWFHDTRTPGLGTSGSGDTLAGMVTGLIARGAGLEQAAVWGVFLHARAGELLAERIGPLGFLAREIPGEVPGLLRGLCADDLP